MCDSDRPTFSVIIPTYNRAHTILRSVLSVLAQTCSDFELIIVDDGSTDCTSDVVSSVADNRVRYIQQQNRGRSAARNVGAAAARGRYITFLDSDDEALPEWLHRLNDGLNGEHIGMVCVGVRIVSEAKNVIDDVLPKTLGASHGNMRGLFLAGSFALHRDLFLEVGGYAEAISHSENTELALRLALLCIDRGLFIATVDEPLVVYYMRDNTGHTDNLEAQFAGSCYILQKHGTRLRSMDPNEYANRCSFAGVSAARLGQYAQARRYLGLAVRANPANWRYCARLALAAIPPLGRKVWNRHRIVQKSVKLS